MNKILNKPITAGLLWGMVGGIVLVLSWDFLGKGYYVMLAWPFTLILALITFKSSSGRNLMEYFKTGLLAFITMTLILYLEIIFFENPAAAGMPLFGHMWRIGLLLAIGILTSFVLSFFVLIVKQLNGKTK
jgi:hypothetical protein